MSIRRLLARLRSRAPEAPVEAGAIAAGGAEGIGASPPTGPSESAEAPGAPAEDRRAAARVRHFGWARFSFGEEAGQGLVTDLSVAGAFVERPTACPPPGSRVELRLKPAGGHPTLPVDCEVVRVEERGFPALRGPRARGRRAPRRGGRGRRGPGQGGSGAGPRWSGPGAGEPRGRAEVPGRLDSGSVEEAGWVPRR